MAKLQHLVVQDIFLTETAYLADVVLPATAWPEKTGTVTNTDRMVQLGRKAVEPPGEAREDFWILVELGKRLGLDWNYQHPKEVFDEMRGCMDSIRGITWERLERDLRRSPTRARTRATRASRWCSPRTSPPPPGARSSCPPT